MTWLRLDDHFEDHEKVVDLSDAAHRLWFRCACWCSQPENEITNGFVPERVVLRYLNGSKARARKLAAELVAARGEPQYGHEHGLWEPSEGGWRFHDWDEYRPEQRKTPAEVSAARSEAGKRGAQARWGDSKTNGKRNGNCHSPPIAKRWQPDAPGPDPDPVTPPDGGDGPGIGSESLRPGNLASALQLPVVHRARYLTANEHAAQWLEPHRWPEVVAVCDAFNEARGLGPPSLQPWHLDGSVRTIVAAFAAGHDQHRLERAVTSWARSDHFREAQERAIRKEGKRPTLAWFKGDLLRTELEELGEDTQVDDDVMAAINRAKESRGSHVSS